MNEFQAFTELVLNSIIVFCYCIHYIDSQLVVNTNWTTLVDLVGNDHPQTSLIVGNDGTTRHKCSNGTSQTIAIVAGCNNSPPVVPSR